MLFFFIDVLFGNSKIGNKRFFINEDHFTLPIYYNVLFGFSPPEELEKSDIQIDENHIQVSEQMLKQRAKELSDSFSPFT